MTDEQIALARRAVACRGWKWMPGMLTGDGFRVCRVDADGYKFGYRTEYNYAYAVIGDVLPMLKDSATHGCLLALVREAHAVPFLQVSVKISREHGYQFDCHPHHRGQWVDSEAEALVAALEAAPCGQ